MLKKLFIISIKTCIASMFLIFCLFFALSLTLPNIDSLKTVQLQEPLRIFTSDDCLIAEFGEIHRIPVSLNQIPKQAIQAVLATEDKRFFMHSGVDPIGLARAGISLIKTGEKKQGGSTITMQVARNFFLTRKKTFSRKIKEVLLAVKIDKCLSKEKILELYLNKVFYGHRAYGIAAAAKIYYGKQLDQLTISEIAMLTGLPKAPSVLNPIANPEAAKERRNHVLKRMLEATYIDQETYEKAILEPITAKYHNIKNSVDAPFIAEMVRENLFKHFDNKIYSLGLNVYTTIDSKQQIAANNAVQTALLDYDKRHGYLGSEQNLGKPNLEKLDSWIKFLKQKNTIKDLQPAIVLDIQDKSAEALLKNGNVITIEWDGLSWARKQIIKDDQEYFAQKPEYASEVLKVGDVIRVRKNKTVWELSQIPQIEAALVSLNPKNGAILSLVGGFDYYNKSKFNRVTQAQRLAGSSFKPFVYSAALEKGFTLASLINDAPIVMEDSGENALWRPENHSHVFYGPTRLRTALTKSRNLVSIRLLQAIGTQYAVDYVTRFGFNKKQLPNSLSLALGTATVTPIQLARGYAVFANGGYLVTPYFIDRIISSNNKVTYKANPLTVPSDVNEEEQTNKNKYATRVITQQNAYLITSALQDVINEGTGRRIHSAIHRNDLSGKTGTTDNKNDTWFAGFNNDLVAVVWAGFDQMRPVFEYAARLAVPLWIDFMKIVLEDKEESTMPMPKDLVKVKIDKFTGLLAKNTTKETMIEVFRQEFIPKEKSISVNMMTDFDNNEQLY